MSNPNLETREVNLFSAEFATQPQPVYQELVTKCPFARSLIGGGPVLSRYEDVLWALRHPEIFSSEMEMHMALGTERPMIPQQIDPPAQTKYRKILDPLFAPRRMDETLVWPLEAPMIDAARFRLFREMKVESGLPER